MVIKMNKERVKKYVEVWLRYIKHEDFDTLEKDIEMPLESFIVDMLENLYNRYSSSISYIPVKYDNYSDYIIAPVNGKYSLEDFLLNRLLRSISTFIYRDESHTFMPDSHYQHDFGEIVIDKHRVKTQYSDVKQIRKLVAHEILHGLKTQFFDGNFFRADRYYQMKEELKTIFPNEINDFDILYDQGNYNYKHSGISYSSRFSKHNKREYSSLNLEDFDEILTELEAIFTTKDDYMVVADILKDGSYLIVLSNPDSSNTWITNYAFILDTLMDTQTLFIGLYLEPETFYKEFNVSYTQIFQKYYNSNLSALEILLEQLRKIKENPTDIDKHRDLLNVLYECLDRKYVLSGYNEELRQLDIRRIGLRGLLELVDGKFIPHNTLNYAEEYSTIRGLSKK